MMGVRRKEVMVVLVVVLLNCFGTVLVGCMLSVLLAFVFVLSIWCNHCRQNMNSR